MDGKAKKKCFKKKIQWAERGEGILLELWAEYIHQLRGHRKNSHIYAEMSDKMNKNVFNYTPNEVKIKIHNLTNRYRKEKASIGPSGGSPSEWPLYHRVHGILGQFRLNNLELLVEESIMEDQGPSPLSPTLFPLSPSSPLLASSSASPIPSPLPSASPIPSPLPSSSPIPSFSSPLPSSTVPREPGKKSKIFNFQVELLKKLDVVEGEISKQTKELSKVDERITNLEERRTDLLEKFVNDTSELKDAFINYLNSQN